MKRYIVTLLALLSMVIMTGCFSYTVDYGYDLGLKIMSMSGENLVDGLKCVEGTRGIIERDQYEHSAYGKHLHFKDSTHGLRLDRDDDGQIYLRFSTVTLDDICKKITEELICPHIFGDSVKHTIVSYWKYDNHGGMKCVKLLFDDIEYQVSKNERYIYMTTIVYDKPAAD